MKNLNVNIIIIEMMSIQCRLYEMEILWTKRDILDVEPAERETGRRVKRERQRLYRTKASERRE